MSKDCFVKITNEMIYNEILQIKKHLSKSRSQIKINTWIASTALTLVIGLIMGYVLRL